MDDIQYDPQFVILHYECPECDRKYKVSADNIAEIGTPLCARGHDDAECVITHVSIDVNSVELP